VLPLVVCGGFVGSVGRLGARGEREGISSVPIWQGCQSAAHLQPTVVPAIPIELLEASVLKGSRATKDDLWLSLHVCASWSAVGVVLGLPGLLVPSHLMCVLQARVCAQRKRLCHTCRLS
jgi:hypothetical protein